MPDQLIALQEASWTYRVPMATLRYWLDKGDLTRMRDDHGHLLLSVAELERKMIDYRSSGKDAKEA